MALSQVLWSLNHKEIVPFGALESEKELEDVLQSHIDLLNPNWLVIGRQVKTPNGKFLDLLCMDRNEDLVVIELKKDLTPREVTAQVIEYASYMSEMKPEELAQIYTKYCADYHVESASLNEAFQHKFGKPLDDEQVNQKVQMIIVASEMDSGTEHIIQYLRNTYNVDVNILFFRVFKHGQERFLSRVWYEEELALEETSIQALEWNQEYYVAYGVQGEDRNWEDARKYGFVSAGGGLWYSRTLGFLHPGDRIWVNLPHIGYTGVGRVTGEKMLAKDAVLTVNGKETPMKSLKLEGKYFYSEDNPEKAEYVVPVRWIHTVPQGQAVKEFGFFGNENTVCRPTAVKWQYTIDRLKAKWAEHLLEDVERCAVSGYIVCA